MGFSGKHQKPETQNGHMFSPQLWIIFQKNVPVHNSKSKLCNRLFIKKTLKFWLRRLCFRFVMPSSESARTKSWHVELELVSCTIVLIYLFRSGLFYCYTWSYSLWFFHSDLFSLIAHLQYSLYKQLLSFWLFLNCSSLISSYIITPNHFDWFTPNLSDWYYWYPFLLS